MSVLGSWKLKCCEISMILFAPVCTALGNCLAKALQPLPDFRLNCQHLRFPNYACFHEARSHIFSCCLLADKDLSPCICKRSITTSFRLCTVVSQRRAVKVLLRPWLLGVTCTVHCLHVLTPLSPVLHWDASSLADSCWRTTPSED